MTLTVSAARVDWTAPCPSARDTGTVTAMDPVTDTDTGTGLDIGEHMDQDRFRDRVRDRVRARGGVRDHDGVDGRVEDHRVVETPRAGGW